MNWLVGHWIIISVCVTLCRLPIIQGGTFTLLTPAMAILSMPESQCPAWTQNASLVNTSSPIFIEVWQTRMRTVSHKHCAFAALDKPTKKLGVALMSNSVNSYDSFSGKWQIFVVQHSDRGRMWMSMLMIPVIMFLFSCRALSWWPLSSRSWSVSLASSVSWCASLAR